MSVNIAVIGAGLVGSAFLNQLQHLRPSSISYNVILIARSTRALLSPSYTPLSLTSWSSDLAAQPQSPLSPGDIAAYLERSPAPVILVDNTSDDALARIYPILLSQGVSIATPNKKAFSSDLGLWNSLFAPRSNNSFVYHEATVGAGLPIISTLKDLLLTGDEIVKIEGIVSGTLSFIFNEYSTLSGPEKSFSDIVLQAKELGYTEPDPREDLNGLDVARKLTILARLCGLEVASATSFPVHSLIPRALSSVESTAEFLQKLPAHDSEPAQLNKAAKEQNKVLRYVGKIDFAAKEKVSVGINMYDSSHPFAGLKGSDNVIAFYTKRYGQNPLVIQGAGAGADVTAMGVLGDVLKIADRITE